MNEKGFFMYRTNHKLPAFTLTEVLVTMAISSLLIMLTYAVYSMLGTYFQRVNHQNELWSEKLGFRAAFVRDLDRADSVRYEAQEILFYREGEALAWKLDGANIIRGESPEGFQPGAYSLKVQKLLSPKTGEALPLVEQVALTWPEGSDSSRFVFVKNYPLSILINR